MVTRAFTEVRDPRALAALALAAGLLVYVVGRPLTPLEGWSAAAAGSAPSLLHAAALGFALRSVAPTRSTGELVALACAVVVILEALHVAPLPFAGRGTFDPLDATTAG